MCGNRCDILSSLILVVKVEIFDLAPQAPELEEPTEVPYWTSFTVS